MSETENRLSVPPSPPLFREEVLRHRSERLHGEINLAIPVAWQLIGLTLLGGLVAALVFLGTAAYGRVETVTGSVVLDLGLAPILPTRPGIISAVHVKEGQVVVAGAPLVQVRAEEDMSNGGTMSARTLDALRRQDAGLSDQGNLVLRAAAADQARLSEKVAGLREEITSLDEQVTAQQRLVQLSENELSDAQGVAGKGFISQRDLNARESALLIRRQQLAQLEQTQAARSAELGETRRAIGQAAALAGAQAAGLRSNRSALAQQFAQAESGRGYTLNAPVAGTITAMAARVGLPAKADQTVMVIIPANGRPNAELLVPTSAAGFLEPGQEVKLAVDAFPYQRFGTIEARISSISSVTVPRTASDGTVLPVYLVTAELGQPDIAAFGRRQPLLPGMKLTGRIMTDRQPLLKWLFEPIFAVQGR